METATFHKLFGTVFIKALLLGLLPASQPFYTSADLRAEPAIVGVYHPEGPNDLIVSEAERETLRIAQSNGDPNRYSVVMSNAQETLEFDARVFQLSVSSGPAAHFIDLAPKNDKEHRFGSLMRHLVAKIERGEDGLEFSFLPAEQIAASGIASRISPGHEAQCPEGESRVSADSYCSRALTGSTKALQALLRAGVRKGLFCAPVDLYRVKPAGR